jgi:positive phototaxis protein PixI
MLPSLDSVVSIASLDPLSRSVAPEDTYQRLLSFPLAGQGNSLIPLDQITEILRVNTADILAVPETPSSVLGAYNWRGEMLWLIDLDHLIGHPSLWCTPQVKQPIAIVLEIEGHELGLVVKSMNDIERHNLQELQPVRPGIFPTALLPYLRGYLPSGATVLDLDAIAHHFLGNA